MSEKLNDIIQNNSHCISDKEMQNYVSGSLTSAEMHRVEKHLLDCELCSDALEGLQMLKGNDSIRMLEKNINQMLGEENKKRPVIVWFRQNIKYVAAAAVVVMAVGAFLLKDILNQESSIAFNDSVKQEVEAAPADVAEKPKEIQSDSGRIAPGTYSVNANGVTSNGSDALLTSEVKDDKTIAEGEMITPAPEPVLASKDENKPVTIVMKDVSYAATEPAASRENDRQKTEEAKIPAGAAAAPQANVQVETSERSAKTSKKAPAKPSAGADKDYEGFNETKKQESAAPVPLEDEKVMLDSASLKVRKNKEGVYIIAEEMPEYPGGDAERLKFFQKNIKYPKSKVEGIVYVNFVIDSDGSVSDVKIIRSISSCKECDDEVLRVVKLMPKWKPGRNAGKPVPVQISLPVKFNSR